MQKAGKFGRLQVTRLQIYYGATQAETTLFSFEELQSFDLPMTRFPFLLHHKGALIFQIKRPLFWKNARICPSLEETGWENHPSLTLFKENQSVGINTDDPTVIDCTLNSEWVLVMEKVGRDKSGRFSKKVVV